MPVPTAPRSWINPAYLGAVVLGCALLVAAGVYVPRTSLLAITLAAPQPWIFWTLLVLATVAYFLVAFLTRRI